MVAPFDHRRVLATSANSTQQDATDAVTAALAAAADWRALDFDARAAILLRAADLLAGPWRARINAATMLGQAKTAYQAEIDSACELADFWRFNVHFARQILAEQPIANSKGIWNRTDHRPLEGFVYAVTPFNFTAIAGNLPTAPALMGNVVVWKPSTTQQFAASLIMDLLREAGLPAGVINMLPGVGPEISEVRARPPGSGRHPLHRVDPGVPAVVVRGRRQHRRLPLVPAAGRRNRWQGFHRGPPLGRSRRAADGDGPRLVRVLRAEMFRGFPFVHAGLDLAGAAGPVDRRNRGAGDRLGRGLHATSPAR